MCIVVDAPLLVALFKEKDPDHKEFSPVLNWINAGEGKFVIGGDRYISELRKMKTCLAPLMEFEKRNKVVKISNKEVQEAQSIVLGIESSSDFDDYHLVALIRASGCKLLAIRDQRAHKFLKRSDFYQKPAHRPKLYTGRKNLELLCSKNCANCCKKT